LFREFHKLSKYIKFIKFGSVDLILLKFENGICSEFELNRIFEFKWFGLARENLNRPTREKGEASPATRLTRGLPDIGGPHVSGSINPKRYALFRTVGLEGNPTAHERRLLRREANSLAARVGVGELNRVRRGLATRYGGVVDDGGPLGTSGSSGGGSYLR
jgi:hypothetical protein